MIAKSCPVFHRQFVDQHFKKIKEDVIAKLLAATPQQMRNINKEGISNILNSFYNIILRRVNLNLASEKLLALSKIGQICLV